MFNAQSKTPKHLNSFVACCTAVDVTKTLSTITSQSISTQTTWRYLKNYGLKAVVKQKKPFLTQ